MQLSQWLVVMGKVKTFFRFTIIWIACNLSIPFWVVGHVHLSVNIYEDIIELCTSIGMNIIVAVGFWFNWKDESKNYDKRD
jgi:hypothetical protein